MSTVSLVLTELEQKCVQLLEQWFQEHADSTQYASSDLMSKLGISDGRQYEIIMHRMAEMGAVIPLKQIGMLETQKKLFAKSFKISPKIRSVRESIEEARESNLRKGALNSNAPEPTEIRESLAEFRQALGDGSRIGFVMMEFGTTTAHDGIMAAVRETLGRFGLLALRADDRQFHNDLYYNILTYIYGCRFGIAVFERIEDEIFNPNVALEVGLMLGLRKEVCLMKDKTLRHLHTDIVGRLYRPFDILNPAGTVPDALRSWLTDKGMIK